MPRKAASTNKPTAKKNKNESISEEDVETSRSSEQEEQQQSRAKKQPTGKTASKPAAKPAAKKGKASASSEDVTSESSKSEADSEPKTKKKGRPPKNAVKNPPTNNSKPKPGKTTGKKNAARSSDEKSSSSNSSNDEKPAKKPKNDDEKILEIRTVHTGAFKQAIERIQHVLSEAIFVFTPDNPTDENEVDESYESEEDDDKKKKSKKKAKAKVKENRTGGLKIQRLTEDSNILIRIIMYAHKFEYFKCAEPIISAGIDLPCLYNMLKNVRDNDPITIYINRSTKDRFMYIHSEYTDEEHPEESDLEVALIAVEPKDLPIRKTEFNGRTTVKAEKFNQICKQLSNHADLVEIISINNEIRFKSKSEGGKVSRVIKDSGKKKKGQQGDGQLVQGIYDLKNLMYFSKIPKLSSTLEIFMKNDFPLVLRINIQDLGRMYVFLTPSDPDALG